MKTDNHNLSAKLVLRRAFLRDYHAVQPPRVLDCCQGGGALWTPLRQEFALASYLPVDVKPKAGRLKVDSARLLAQPHLPYDVVDVDCYGSPWRWWLALLPNARAPLTVFLTIGRRNAVAAAPKIPDARELEALGLDDLLRPEWAPKSVRTIFAGKTTAMAIPYLLDRARAHGLRILDARRAVSAAPTIYMGLRLSPEKNTCIGSQVSV